jgi:Pectate lyase superfamily protein
MPKSIPTIGDSNWGTPLNAHLSQLQNPTTGGINTFEQFSQRPTTLTEDDVGKTYLYTQTGNLHQWTGTTWKVLNESVINVKDYGAIGNGVADDTVAIQTLLNNQTYPQAYTIFFPDGEYAVSSLHTTVSEKTLNFGGVAGLLGISTSQQKSVFEIRNHGTRINGLRMNTNFKTNYDAALSFSSVQNGDFPNFCYINGLTIFNSKIGVLYGAITNPISDTVSENHITLMRTRSVEKCIFANQVPLGWLYVSNSVLDCQAYDWGASTNFNHNNSCIYEGGTITSFNNCEFVKAESRLGNAFVNNFQLHITGCSAEIACTLFKLKDTAITQISNFNIPFYNSTSAIFDLDDNTKGELFVTNMRINRVTGASDPTNAVYANHPIVNTKKSKD